MNVLVARLLKQFLGPYFLDKSVLEDAEILGMILPSLAMVNVSYATWLRWMVPLLGMLGLLSAAALVLGVAAA
jgi:hypothetical protein